MISFLLIFFIYQITQAEQYHVSMLMLSAPKNIPMINYTCDYLINAFQRKPDEIIIDHFYFIKGCHNCSYDEMDIAMKEMNSNGMNTSILEIPQFEWIHKNNIYAFEEMYHSLWSEDKRNYRHYEHHKKDNIVTYYFHEGIKKVLENEPLTNYLMFFEDDVSLHRDSFQYLKDLFDNYGPRTMTKYATPLKVKEDGYFDPKIACIWGWWGTIMSRFEIERYLTFIKFNPWTYCGDMLFCDLGILIDQPMYLKQFGRHFGRDKVIKPRDPNYY